MQLTMHSVTKGWIKEKEGLKEFRRIEIIVKDFGFTRVINTSAVFANVASMVMWVLLLAGWSGAKLARRLGGGCWRTHPSCGLRGVGSQ